jgi:hypothetical protein
MMLGFFLNVFGDGPVPTDFLFKEKGVGIYLVSCFTFMSLPACLSACLPACLLGTNVSVSLFLPCVGILEGSGADYKCVDDDVGGEKNSEGTNILVQHVTGLTVTLNGEHVSLHAGVNED